LAPDRVLAPAAGKLLTRDEAFLIAVNIAKRSVRRKTSMTDNLQLGIFVAVLIAFVLVGCVATRAPKKTP
jgi:hypothetical protein